MKNINTIMILMLINISFAFSQNPYFSQIFQSPLLLSPTLASISDADARVQVVARHQWGSVLKKQAYKTIYASYDQREVIGLRDFFGIGGMVLGDQAGQAKLTSSSILGVFSYGKNIYSYRGRARYLVIGGLFGWANRKLHQDNLIWGSQYDGANGFDLQANSEENLSRTSFNYWDTGIGLQYYEVSQDRSYHFGLSYNHFNQPSNSFYDERIEKLKPLVNIFWGGQWDFPKERLTLLAYGLLQKQGLFLQLQTNVNARYPIHRSQGEFVEGGIGVRMANFLEKYGTSALLFHLGYQYNQIRIGLNYDMNLLGWRGAGRNTGAYEVALSYLLDLKKQRTVLCPVF